MKTFRFYEDRTTYFRVQLLETVDGVKGGKNVAAEATTKVYLRAYESAEGALILNQELTKVEITAGQYPDTAPAKSGVAGDVRFTSKYDRVECRIIVVDETTEDVNAYSGYQEKVFGKPWSTKVYPSVQPPV